MHHADFVQLLDNTSPEDLGDRLREASDAAPEDAGRAFDALGLEIARRYHSGLISFYEADCSINTMFSAMCHGLFFTDYFDSTRLAFRVFAAFDEGEYVHRSDEDSVDPVKKYTDPSIELIVKEFSNA
jgi:hypothetical protein